MTPLALIPLPWKIGAAAVLVGLLAAGHLYRVHAADGAGYSRAVTERAAADGRAIIARTQANGALALKQDATNVAITKAKDAEIAPIIKRIYVDRVRVGPATCGPAAPAQAEGTSVSDEGNPPGRLVREDIERDTRALTEAVEQDLATGRACQAFVRENGLAP